MKYHLIEYKNYHNVGKMACHCSKLSETMDHWRMLSKSGDKIVAIYEVIECMGTDNAIKIMKKKGAKNWVYDGNILKFYKKDETYLGYFDNKVSELFISIDFNSLSFAFYKKYL
jgi:hypothetical protein